MTPRKATSIVIPINVEPYPCSELTLDEMLSDSVVRAVMRADAVDPLELRAMLGKIAATRRGWIDPVRAGTELCCCA